VRARDEDAHAEGFPVVLTADRTLFTDYAGFSGSGFLTCLPARLIPRYFLYHFLCPRVSSVNGRALVAPYSLRKVEASLLANGFSEDEVVVAHPDDLDEVVGNVTRVVGITTVDPKGYAPVSHTLCDLFGGGEPCTAREFKALLNSKAIRKHKDHIKVIVGGPGVWQLSDEDASSLGIDVICVGGGERAIAELFKRAVEGERLPRRVSLGQSDLNFVPKIVNPARGGHVEITRGCGRGCQFCTQTARRWISFPRDYVLEEVKVNLRAGLQDVSLITDDGLRYGSKGIDVNREAVLDLFKSILSLEGVRSVGFAHVSFSSVVQAPDLIRELTELCGYTKENPFIGPQIGLESGSPRLIEKYMIGKPKPFKPMDWPEIVVQATRILNENYWYPCTTLIMGLPGEEEDDVLRTLELIDELKGSKQWLFPLFFSPMSPSSLEREKGFTVDDMTEAHWELLIKCYEHDIKYTKEIINKVIVPGGGVLNAKRFVRTFIERGLSMAESFLDDLKRDPRRALEQLKAVKIESLWDMVKLIRKIV
jgi:radical SAM superfamily enzyme YgiQ (UPF0313 family)